MKAKKTRKPNKLHVKKGDQVLIIAGNYKGDVGEISKVIPEKNRAIVAGVNIVYKHVKPTAENPEGGVQEKEAPIHISNLMVINPETGKPARVKRQKNAETGKLERVFKDTKRIVE
ncbi:MAG: 50S ribosomal protein L24 [Bernardetiaceae bacterium]|nr:50S ribosomal protein L24 [Bernardetiaceae bacterium]